MKKIKTTLIGVNGNAFALMGKFSQAARREGWNKEEIDAVLNKAMEGDYNHLVATLLENIDDDHS